MAIYAELDPGGEFRGAHRREISSDGGYHGELIYKLQSFDEYLRSTD